MWPLTHIPFAFLSVLLHVWRSDIASKIWQTVIAISAVRNKHFLTRRDVYTKLKNKKTKNTLVWMRTTHEVFYNLKKKKIRKTRVIACISWSSNVSHITAAAPTSLQYGPNAKALAASVGDVTPHQTQSLSMNYVCWTGVLLDWEHLHLPVHWRQWRWHSQQSGCHYLRRSPDHRIQ